MQWKADYSVGIESIDQQHRVLLDYFNLIEDTVGSGGSWSNLHFILIQLRDFARIHFAVEEALMDIFAYPNAAEHIGEHGGFFVELKQLEQRSLTTDVNREAVEFLHQWLLRHITGADQGYARHIAARAPGLLAKTAGRSAQA